MILIISMIVYTYKEPLFCCSIVEECVVAVASVRALILWDFFAGKELSAYEFEQKLTPLSLASFDRQNIKHLILQSKQGKTLVFTVHQSRATKTSQYNLSTLGFTRLPFSSIYIDQSDKIHKQVCDHFFTVREKNIIEKREILTGMLKHEYQTSVKFYQVNFLLSIEAVTEFYYFVAEEGGRIKKIIIGQKDQIKSESTLELSSKDELKIILWIEAISSKLAFVCLRNSDIVQINLQKMQSTLTMDLFGARIIKTIPIEPKNAQSIEYAFSTKTEIGFFSKGKIKAREKIDKNFILDMDTMPLGLVGVTEQGKIAFLPMIQ